MNIHTTTYSPRPCIVCGRWKAMFHGWYTRFFTIPPSPMIGGPPGGQGTALHAIVEYENGICKLVDYDDIEFIDHSEFAGIAWPEYMKEKNDD